MFKVIVLILGSALFVGTSAAANVCVELAGSETLKPGQIDLCAKLAAMNASFFSETAFVDQNTPEVNVRARSCTTAKTLARHRAMARCALVAARDGRDTKSCVEFSTFVTAREVYTTSTSKSQLSRLPSCEAESVFYLDPVVNVITLPADKVNYDRLVARARDLKISVSEFVIRALNERGAL